MDCERSYAVLKPVKRLLMVGLSFDRSVCVPERELLTDKIRLRFIAGSYLSLDFGRDINIDAHLANDDRWTRLTR
jgi:hypothetical protein